MKVVIVADAAAAGVEVAERIDRAMRAAEGRIVLGLATGSSPLPAYRELIRRHREEGLSFAEAEIFMLDEYVGLDAEHEQSYHRTIRTELTEHVDAVDSRVHAPDGAAADPVTAGQQYDRAIAEAGGVELQLLGIGSNGHIAFNEPGTSLVSRTGPVWLTESTIQDNARFFASAEEVPVRALTQGLGTIRDARSIVLVATGDGKAEAVAAMLEGPVSARCPASCLQLHEDVTVVIDEDAASRLEMLDYYRHQQRQEESTRR